MRGGRIYSIVKAPRIVPFDNRGDERIKTKYCAYDDMMISRRRRMTEKFNKQRFLQALFFHLPPSSSTCRPKWIPSTRVGWHRTICRTYFGDPLETALSVVGIQEGKAVNDDVKTLIRYSNGTTATQHVLNCVAKNWYILSESHRHHHQIKRFQLLFLLQKRVFENNNSTCCIIRILICMDNS